MPFLADVYAPCEACWGRRFNDTTLEIVYKGHAIADVLDLSVRQARELFARHPMIRAILDTLMDVGLGYIKLGQSAVTLSGGEAQRIKLAREMGDRPGPRGRQRRGATGGGGPPEAVAGIKASHTGRYWKEIVPATSQGAQDPRGLGFAWQPNHTILLSDLTNRMARPVDRMAGSILFICFYKSPSGQSTS
jgi:hypothetical protein